MIFIILCFFYKYNKIHNINLLEVKLKKRPKTLLYLSKKEDRLILLWSQNPLFVFESV